MSAAILEARGLQAVRGGVQVLAIPELRVQEGSVLALIGPNGSGKSSLLLALAGLIPAAGEIAFRGVPIGPAGDGSGYRRRVTMVFQDPLLFDATVRENIASGLRLRRLPRAELDARVQESAERFGIAPLLDRAARKLSGGEAQRTSLARSFALRPELIFLDEPFTTLDPPSREALIGELGKVLRETRTTAVLATHDQTEAMCLADAIAVLREGRIVQMGTVDEVINHPADAFVAAFVGMETVITGTVRSCGPGTVVLEVLGREVEAVGQGVPGQEMRMGVRPEHVTLNLRTGEDSSARNLIPGVVTRIVPRGPFVKVELDCGFYLAACVTLRSREDLGLREGLELVASFKATAVHHLRG